MDDSMFVDRGELMFLDEGNQEANAIPFRKRGGQPTVIGSDPVDIANFSESVKFLRAMGYKWKTICSELFVNERFMRRWREKNNFVDPQRALITDDQLDDLVSSYVKDHPKRGEVMLDGCLAAAKCVVTRKRLRESIKRVDPVGLQSRKSKPIRRRTYQVAGPHHLWHIDGNHKLTKFNMVIHAGIDGFSRALMYVHCADNNRAQTALDAFIKGVQEYGVPSRIRTDQGLENIDIARFMAAFHGPNRRSFIAGKSTHNQRIERQWRDMTKEVTSFYRELFFGMENRHDLDFSDRLTLFCLHYLFLARINEDLKLYMERWNNHKISTQKNQTPLQLLFSNRGLSAAIPSPIDIDEEYGIEENDDDEHPELETIVDHIPVACPLNVEQYQQFRTSFQPFTLNDVDHLEERFLNCLAFARQL
jgi:hypothetical protein